MRDSYVHACFCVVISGRFQDGTRGSIVDSCLKKSVLCEHIIVQHLHTESPINTSSDVIQLPESINTFVFNTNELIIRFIIQLYEYGLAIGT